MLIVYTLHVPYDHKFNFLKQLDDVNMGLWKVGYMYNTIYIYVYTHNKYVMSSFPIIYQLIKFFL